VHLIDSSLTSIAILLRWLVEAGRRGGLFKRKTKKRPGRRRGGNELIHGLTTVFTTGNQ
jgi:hypothetical protein